MEGEAPGVAVRTNLATVAADVAHLGVRKGRPAAIEAARLLADSAVHNLSEPGRLKPPLYVKILHHGIVHRWPNARDRIVVGVRMHTICE